MKIVVNKHLCVGAGRCAEAAPQVFGVSDADGLVFLRHDGVRTVDDIVVEDAVDACPSGAIRLEEGG